MRKFPEEKSKSTKVIGTILIWLIWLILMFGLGGVLLWIIKWILRM